MKMTDTETSIRLRIKEFVAMRIGVNASKKFTPRGGDHGFVLIGNGKNWTAPTTPTHCS